MSEPQKNGHFKGVNYKRGHVPAKKAHLQMRSNELLVGHLFEGSTKGHHQAMSECVTKNLDKGSCSIRQLKSQIEVALESLFMGLLYTREAFIRKGIVCILSILFFIIIIFVFTCTGEFE